MYIESHWRASIHLKCNRQTWTSKNIRTSGDRSVLALFVCEFLDGFGIKNRCCRMQCPWQINVLLHVLLALFRASIVSQSSVIILPRRSTYYESILITTLTAANKTSIDDASRDNRRIMRTYFCRNHVTLCEFGLRRCSDTKSLSFVHWIFIYAMCRQWTFPMWEYSFREILLAVNFNEWWEKNFERVLCILLSRN